MYSSPTSEKQNSWRFALVAGSIVVITLLHYTIDVRAGAFHDVLLRAYYIPIDHLR